jgi:hypothetical protein
MASSAGNKIYFFIRPNLASFMHCTDLLTNKNSTCFLNQVLFVNKLALSKNDARFHLGVLGLAGN